MYGDASQFKSAPPFSRNPEETYLRMLAEMDERWAEEAEEQNKRQRSSENGKHADILSREQGERLVETTMQAPEFGNDERCSEVVSA